MNHLTPRHLLVAQLRKDRDQFSFYATNHRAKTGDPLLSVSVHGDALVKAIANETMAAEIDALIGGPDSLHDDQAEHATLDAAQEMFDEATAQVRARKDAEVDLVNRPPHYTGGAIECIDALQSALTPEEFSGFCRGNAIKYMWRARLKGAATQDMEKAVWYTRMAAGDDPRREAS